MIRYLIFILFTFFISACGNNDTYFTQKFKQLEEQVNDHPQQVLDSLKKIPLARLSQGETAHYYLLEAIALDKNFKNIPSDSTLLMASHYYTNEEDYYNLARTQIYLALYQIYQENDRETAYKYLKEAEINYNNSSQPDAKTLGFIYYWLGQIQHKQNNFNEAEDYYNKSIEIFQQRQDSLSLLYSLKQLGWLYIFNKKYRESENIFEHSIDILSSTKKNNDKNTIVLKASILNAQNFLYRKTDDINKSLEIGKQCIQILEKNNLEIPSGYYFGIIMCYNNLNLIDSCRYYCTKMISTAEKEENLTSIISSYKLLYQLEEEQGNYKEACKLREKYNQLKDQYSHQNKSESFLKLERRYTQSQKEKSILEEKNKILWVTTVSMAFGFAAIILIFFLAWSRRKLIRRNEELEKEIVKTRWGYAVSKELIADNSNPYTELEHILMVNIQNIPSKIYDKIQQCIRDEKNKYSSHIFSALSNIDVQFTKRIKKLHPELGPEDTLIASMIKHQWTMHDITRVFRVSSDAIQKRRYRLKIKLLGHDADMSQLDKYIRSI